MFKVDAEKFYNGLLKAKDAKDEFLKCNEILRGLDSNYKDNLINCGIQALIDKIEFIQSDLMLKDPDFCDEYYKIIVNRQQDLSGAAMELSAVEFDNLVDDAQFSKRNYDFLIYAMLTQRKDDPTFDFEPYVEQYNVLGEQIKLYKLTTHFSYHY